MPYITPQQRAAGSTAWVSDDPHDGGPCGCDWSVPTSAAALRHRALAGPDQSRYGPEPVKRVRFNRRPSMHVTREAGGHVATCLGCGVFVFNVDQSVVRKWAQGHEECPQPQRKRK